MRNGTMGHEHETRAWYRLSMQPAKLSSPDLLTGSTWQQLAALHPHFRITRRKTDHCVNELDAPCASRVECVSFITVAKRPNRADSPAVGSVAWDCVSPLQPPPVPLMRLRPGARRPPRPRWSAAPAARNPEGRWRTRPAAPGAAPCWRWSGPGPQSP